MKSLTALILCAGAAAPTLLHAAMPSVPLFLEPDVNAYVVKYISPDNPDLAAAQPVQEPGKQREGWKHLVHKITTNGFVKLDSVGKSLEIKPGTTVYTLPDSSSNVLATIEPGDDTEIVYTGDWAEIKLTKAILVFAKDGLTEKGLKRARSRDRSGDPSDFSPTAAQEAGDFVTPGRDMQPYEESFPLDQPPPPLPEGELPIARTTPPPATQPQEPAVVVDPVFDQPAPSAAEDGILTVEEMRSPEITGDIAPPLVVGTAKGIEQVYQTPNLPRHYEGTLQFAKSRFGKPPHLLEIVDGKGTRLAYVETAEMLSIHPLNRLIDQEVVVYGIPRKIEDERALLLEARSARLQHPNGR